MLRFFFSLWLSLSLVFLALRIAPGDPVDIMLEHYPLAEQKAQIYQSLGLNQPLLQQYQNYFLNFISGNWQESWSQKKPVIAILKPALVNTLKLAALTFLFSNAIGLALGLLGAFYANARLTGFFLSLVQVLVSTPVFWLGPLMIVAFCLHWPHIALNSIVLAAITLSIILASQIILITQKTIAEILTHDFIRAAYSKGLKPFTVLIKHALPNAAIPIFSKSFLQLGHLLSGVMITETIFNINGLGKLCVDALAVRDYPLIQGCLFIALVATLFTNQVLIGTLTKKYNL